MDVPVPRGSAPNTPWKNRIEKAVLLGRRNRSGMISGISALRLLFAPGARFLPYQGHAALTKVVSCSSRYQYECF
jgi:hypothetical protein